MWAVTGDDGGVVRGAATDRSALAATGGSHGRQRAFWLCDGAGPAVVDLDRGIVRAGHGTLDRSAEVLHMAWCRPSAATAAVGAVAQDQQALVARRSGVIDRIDVATGQVVHQYAQFDGEVFAGVGQTTAKYVARDPILWCPPHAGHAHPMSRDGGDARAFASGCW